MVKTVFCPNCNAEMEYRVINREKTFVVRGESITVKGDLIVCSKCNQEITDDEYYGKLMEEAYGIYRKVKGILFPEEIARIRERYNISQRSLAKLLGMGEITIQRYEKGAIPDPVQNAQLCDLKDPINMIHRLKERGHLLDARTRERLTENLKDAEKLEEIKRIAGNDAPSIENGFRKFDLEKLGQMIVFFAHKCSGLPKTKALKLAFYSDFLSYRERALSISGSPYARFPHGPVPKKYETILGILEEDGVIVKVEKDFGLYSGEEICAVDEFNPSIFTQDEVEILEYVISVLGDKTAKEVRDLSHLEKGWLETPDRNLISYVYADEIKAL